MKKEKILAGSFAACLFIFLIAAIKFEPSALAKEQKTFLQKELSSLSNKERKSLKELFDHHLFFSDFAYTLFGSKPMSIGRFHVDQKTGWQAWEKVKGSFSSKQFVIRKYAIDGHEFILVANVEKIEQIFRQYHMRFKQALNSHISLDTLISCLKEDGPLFQKVMHNHLLVGILLGYGVHNAELFARNQDLVKEKKVALKPFSQKVHPIFYLFSKTLPISFACDPSTEETKRLKERYEKERKQILKMGKKDPLFLRMLVQLSGSDRADRTSTFEK